MEDKVQSFKGRLEDGANAVYNNHIMVPESISEWYLKQAIKRVVCTINNNYTWQCALLPKGGGRYFILINAEIRKKQQLKPGVEIEIQLKPDTSKYGMPMPEVMGILLAEDEVASKYFHLLTPGKQRSLLHIIGKPKTEATRLKKAIVITEYLKTNKGKLDWKELQIAFKEYP